MDRRTVLKGFIPWINYEVQEICVYTQRVRFFLMNMN